MDVRLEIAQIRVVDSAFLHVIERAFAETQAADQGIVDCGRVLRSVDAMQCQLTLVPIQSLCKPSGLPRATDIFRSQMRVLHCQHGPTLRTYVQKSLRRMSMSKGETPKKMESAGS